MDFLSADLEYLDHEDVIGSRLISRVTRLSPVLPLITSLEEHTHVCSGALHLRSDSEASCYWLEPTNSICTLDGSAGMLQMEELEKHKSPTRLLFTRRLWRLISLFLNFFNFF